MASKKDYEIIARCIKCEVETAKKQREWVPIELSSLVLALCWEFKEDNIHFKADKFKTACGF